MKVGDRVRVTDDFPGTGARGREGRVVHIDPYASYPVSVRLYGSDHLGGLHAYLFNEVELVESPRPAQPVQLQDLDQHAVLHVLKHVRSMVDDLITATRRKIDNEQ